MGKGKKQTIGYWYRMGLHMGICKGPIDMLIAIMGGERIFWSGQVTSNRRLWIQAPNLWGGEKREGGVEGDLDVMFGAPDQMPNDYLASAQGGVHNPAYRGIFSTVFRRGRVGAISPYVKPWAYRIRRIKAGWEEGVCWYPEAAEVDVGEGPPLTPIGAPTIRTPHLGEIPTTPVPTPPPARILCANPAHIIYEIMTDKEDGMSHPPGMFNDAEWRAAADLFKAEKLGLFIKWMQSEKISDTLQQILDHANAMLVQSPEDLRWTLIPMRGDYVLADLPSYGPKGAGYDVDCVLESFERATIEETVNEVTVTWNDSADNQERSVTVQNLAAIQAAGGVVNQTKAYAGCPTEAIAARLAQRDLDVLSAMLSRVRIRANRRAYKAVPGKVIRLSWPAYGILNMPIRVLKVTDYGSDGGQIVIEGTEDVFKFGLTSYIKPQPPGWTDPNGPAQPAAYVDAFEVPFRDIVQVIGIDAAKELDPMVSYFGMVASQPPGLATSFNAYARTGAGEWADNGSGQFTPTATLSAAVGRGATVLPITNVIGSWATLEPGSVVFLGNHPDAEVVRVDSMNAAGTQITVARGCLDTLPPKEWPIGTRLWAYDNDSVMSTTQYALGEQVTARAVTNSGRGQLAIEVAPEDSVTMNIRAARPYPPARMRINGADDQANLSGNLVVTWRHRDRWLQGDKAIGQEEAGAGPDPLTRYGMRFLDSAGNNLVARSDIAGITATVVLAYTGTVDMELWALNDDGTSWQRYRRRFDYTMPPGTLASSITAPAWVRPETIIDGGEVVPNG